MELKLSSAVLFSDTRNYGLYYTVINEAACSRGAESTLHRSEKDLITGSELDFQVGTGPC